MAHGYDDYGVSKAARTVHATPDLAEESVRLGAISSVDRRGNVIQYDDFEPATLKWDLTSLGTRTYKSDDQARSGDYSLFLTTLPIEGSTESGHILLAYPMASRFGAEMWFLWEGLDIIIRVVMTIRDITGEYEGSMRYNTATDTLQYYASGGPWTTLETFPFPLMTLTFWPMKIVCDAINHQYVRCLFADREYDLTTLPLDLVGAAGSSYVDASVSVETLVDDSPHMYIDDFIFTQNEP